MKKRLTYWLISFVVTISIWFLLSSHLARVHTTYQRESFQLIDQETASNYLKSFWAATNRGLDMQPVLIPTGIFIESIAWIDANSFLISGYIWQHSSSSEPKIDLGFILPEAIELKQEEGYRIPSSTGETIGWYFEGKIVQRFDYSKYPFDHKIIRVRMWPKDMDQRALLVPFFSSYDRKDRDGIFGLDPKITLSGYDLINTYFRYEHTSYDTNFGFTSFTPQKEFPELYFNIVLRRDVLDAVIVHVLPLLAVFILCFTALLSTTFDEQRREIYNFRFLEIVTQSAALFFVLLLAHIHLRESFAGIGIVYLEYIYVLLYLSIMYITVNAYFVVHAEFSDYSFYRLVRYEDNLLPKIIFLPLFSALIYAVSLSFF